MRREQFILMSVGGLTLDPVTKTPIVILKDSDNKLNLPIWIGLLEATAMATELEGIKMARPMTHDLLRNVLGELGAMVEAIEVTDLRDNTYYRGHPSATSRVGVWPSIRRPSDAISLALRTKSPIYVAKKVLESSSVLQQIGRGQGSQSIQRLARQMGRDPREDGPGRLQVQDVMRASGSPQSRSRNPWPRASGARSSRNRTSS